MGCLGTRTTCKYKNCYLVSRHISHLKTFALEILIKLPWALGLFNCGVYAAIDNDGQIMNSITIIICFMLYIKYIA